MSIGLALLIGFALLTVGTAVVGWLKGNLGLVRSGFSELVQRRGDVRTWMALFVPGESAVAMFFSAAWQLAQPDSYWARRFYSDRKMERARALHG